MLELALWLKRTLPRGSGAGLPASPMGDRDGHVSQRQESAAQGSPAQAKRCASKGLKVRRLHKAFCVTNDPNNWPILREALRRMGRADLIGNGKQHLVPGGNRRDRSMRPKASVQPKPARPFRTQHTR